MKLGIIGCGAIGSDVAKAADSMNEVEKIYIFDIDKKSEERLNKDIKKSEIGNVKDFLNKVDVIFEAASQEAVKEYAVDILKAGKDIVIMSVGILFDDKFRKNLEKIAREKKCKIVVL